MLLRAISVDGDRPALILPGGQVFVVGLLRLWDASAELAAWRRSVSGASIAICCRDNALLAMALLALDGVAGRITLLPTGLSSESAHALCMKAGVTALLAPGELSEFPGYVALPMPPMPQASLTPADALTPTLVTEWVIPTSGTTRTPKPVVHTMESLSRSVKRDDVRGAKIRWGLLYDLNRFAGLQVFLQAMLGGSSLLIPPCGASLDETLRVFAEAGCNALSATPTLWRKILMTPGAELPLCHITLGGEIADRSILAALAARFPSARIVHIYASTEVGVGFSVRDGKEGFPVEYLRDGVPGAELRVSCAGILEIRPFLHRQRYLDESIALAGPDGFVNTGDRVLISDTRVCFLGRDSGAINVGGNKVQPEEVELVLLAHPLVAMAAVWAKRSGITGALVEARVVLRADVAAPADVVAQLRVLCAENLDRHKVPAFIRVVDNIEPGDSGKIARS